MDQQCESKCNKLLASSTSGDTGTRVTGEAVYDKLPANGELMYLLDTMTGIQNTESTRITASILMQSLLNDGFDQAYSVLTPEEQDDLKVRVGFLKSWREVSAPQNGHKSTSVGIFII